MGKNQFYRRSFGLMRLDIVLFVLLLVVDAVWLWRFPIDKIQHFEICFFINLVMSFFPPFSRFLPYQRIFFVFLFVGCGKELYDAAVGGFVEFFDVVSGVLGSTLSELLVLAARSGERE